MPQFSFKVIAICTVIIFAIGFAFGMFYKNYQIKSAYQKAAKQILEILNSDPNQIPIKK